jgi:hypothetical protein
MQCKILGPKMKIKIMVKYKDFHSHKAKHSFYFACLASNKLHSIRFEIH